MNDNENEAGKVIDFKPGPRFGVRRRQNARCQHQGGIIVDEQTRTVECETCKCVLDPFDYLLDMANREACLDRTHLRLEAENMKLANQQVELKAQLDKTRSALNRAKKNANG